MYSLSVLSIQLMRKQGVSYRAFAASLALQKKIYLFTGVPMFLVFDGEGKQVLREGGGAENEYYSALTPPFAPH